MYGLISGTATFGKTKGKVPNKGYDEMDVILLEKIDKLGSLGDVVKVKNGFGRNFLIPEGRALPATKGNQAKFEAERAEYEKRQDEVKAAAEALAAKVEERQHLDLLIQIVDPAGERAEVADAMRAAVLPWSSASELMESFHAEPRWHARWHAKLIPASRTSRIRPRA